MILQKIKDGDLDPSDEVRFLIVEGFIFLVIGD